MKLKQLDIKGFAHDVLLVGLVAVMAIVGAAYTVATHASSTKPSGNWNYLGKASASGETISAYACKYGVGTNEWQVDGFFSLSSSYKTKNSWLATITNKGSGPFPDGSSISGYFNNTSSPIISLGFLVYSNVNNYLTFSYNSSGSGVASSIHPGSLPTCSSGTAAVPIYNIPSGPVGHVVGCTDYSASLGCVGQWWYASGGPTVYSDTSGAILANYVYIDDSTPCGPNEPAPMNQINAPDGSTQCEQDWVNYYRQKNPSAIIYAAIANNGSISPRFQNANYSLQEWYPAFYNSTTLSCGAQGYIVQRYFNGSTASTPQYSGFNKLWADAITCDSSSNKVLAWY